MPLITEFRPQIWGEVYGHNAEVKSFAHAIAARSAQTYLLSGPSGCGKTTLARIAANELGCTPENTIAYDAAYFPGVDDVRRLNNELLYKPFGANGTTRALIMDECHMLSKSSWNVLLKPTEEPPPNVFWLFCTTQPDKVPPTILTRSLHLQLRLLHDDELTDLVQSIAELADINLADGVRGLIVREAHGSPRQALTNLEACRAPDIDRAEAARILNTVIDTDASLALCKALTTEGTTWRDCMKLMERLEGENAEGLRIQILHYLSKGARNAKDDRGATFFLQRIEAFAFPYGMADANAQLLRSLGACIFGP